MIKPKNITHIESLRGIAALMVVLFHFISFYNGEKFLFDSANVRKISEFGAQGVEMFYIISGFVMMLAFKRSNYELKNYFNYTIKRSLRILPTYWSTIFMICCISFVLNTFLWKIPYDWNIRNILTNATFTADLFHRDWINPIFITLKVEFQFYILIGLLYPFWSKSNLLKITLIILSLSLTYLSEDYNNFIKYLPYFLIGMISFEIYSNKNRKNISMLFIPIFYLIIFNSFEDIIISVLTTLLILFDYPQQKYLNKIGDVSYSLYLTHGLSGGWILYFLTLYFGNKHNILFLGIAVLISILFAFIVHRFIEKPTMNISQKINYKSTLKNNIQQLFNK